VLIILGLNSDPATARILQEAFTTRFGANVTVLDGSTTPRSDRAGIEQSIGALAQQSTAGDRVVVVMLGHASAEGDDARFNIPGPDITGRELNGWLSSLRDRQLTVV